MSRPSDIRRAHAALHAEHTALHEVADRLAGADDSAELAEILDRLHGLLRNHFDREELPGGLYEQMGATSGERRELVDTLADEHYHLLLAVSGLADRARAGDGDGLGMAGLLRQARGILSLLASHEDREQALVEMTSP